MPSVCGRFDGGHPNSEQFYVLPRAMSLPIRSCRFPSLVRSGHGGLQSQMRNPMHNAHYTNKRSIIPGTAASLCALLTTFSVCLTAQQWTNSGPLPRYSHSAVLDPSSNKMIVFGGALAQLNDTGLDLGDLWWLNNTGGVGLSWSRVPISGAHPSPRSGQSAIYDPGSNRMVIFGGGLGLASPCTSQVWALENANGVGGSPAWTQFSPSGGPPAPRLRHTAVYDPNTNTMIIYGGNDCFSARYADVWILKNANGIGGTPTWTQLFPTGVAPAGRQDSSAVYDPASNRMVIYGGDEGTPTADNSVWLLTNANGTGGTPAWIELSPSGAAPPVRALSSAVYDAANNIMTIFGGSSEAGAGLLNDTWILAGANGLGSPVWTQLNPTLTTGPALRAGHTAVYNPTTNKMTIFGGVGTPPGTNITNAYFQDVWVMSNANGQ